VFTLDTTLSSPSSVSLDESGIAWSSDSDKFVQPKGFKYVRVNSFAGTCGDANMPEDCKQYTDPSTGDKFLFYYPNDETVQYLYESYPNHISPIDGVTNDHFKVWMRPAALPQFRKLYGQFLL
jgi:hypothetical protein